MNKIAILSVVLIGLAAIAANAAPRGGNTQRIGVGIQTPVRTGLTTARATTDTTATTVSQTTLDEMESAKKACHDNNIGVGGVFVWANNKFVGGYSDYSSMVEDTDDVTNNTCFVRVDLTSSNTSRVDMKQFKSMYYPVNTMINCGSWVYKSDIERAILDAKKSGRTWGTVAGAVGGAGVGVGAMELFGNRAIGGKVMGDTNPMDQTDRKTYAELKAQVEANNAKIKELSGE